MSDNLLDDLIEGGRAEIKREQQRRHELSSMSAEQRNAVRDRLVVTLVQLPDVILQVERCHCFHCGTTYQTPVGIMLHYEDTHRKLKVWKRATPESVIPDNPAKSIRYIETEVWTCQNCWLGEIDLSAVAKKQPSDTITPQKPDKPNEDATRELDKLLETL